MLSHKSSFRILLVAALLVPAIYTTSAQQAEPVRIQPKPGSHAALLTCQLSGSQQKEYIIGLHKGQRVTFAFATTTSKTAFKVRLRSPGDTDVELSKAGPRRWAATLGEDGDYQVWVIHNAQTPARNSYTLSVTVR